MKPGVWASLTRLAVAVVSACSLANAQDGFPSKPIRIIVPFSTGSQTDLLARMLGQKMSENWAQPVLVENRPGAGGVVAGSSVATAKPDGYTLLLHSSGFAGSAALYSKLPYDPLKDFASVSQVASTPVVLVVAPALNVSSVKELVALARQRPGQVNFGSAGIGSGTHMAGEQFKLAALIDVVHVPYKGPPEALTDTMTGRVQYSFSPMQPALPFIRDGRLLALGVSTAQRSPALPEVPSISEAVAGYEHDGWFAMWAPANTPKPVVNQLSKAVARVLELPDIRDRMLRDGLLPKSSTPDQLANLVRAEIEKLRVLVKASGLRPE
jgi:tripartite-type tricarboxylate transporter receptor subunit TctC